MSLGFRIPLCGFRIPCLWIPASKAVDSGFHNQQPGFWITIMVGFRIPSAGFRIPKPWIPDSTDQNYLDSGFRISLHGARFWEPFEIRKLWFVILRVDFGYFVKPAGAIAIYKRRVPCLMKIPCCIYTDFK